MSIPSEFLNDIPEELIEVEEAGENRGGEDNIYLKNF
jgi:hypothetical protein